MRLVVAQAKRCWDRAIQRPPRHLLGRASVGQSMEALLRDISSKAPQRRLWLDKSWLFRAAGGGGVVRYCCSRSIIFGSCCLVRDVESNWSNNSVVLYIGATGAGNRPANGGMLVRNRAPRFAAER